MTLPARTDRPSMRLLLADILTTDDEPWPVCPRGQLRRAIAALHERHGLSLVAGFEHECYITGLQSAPTPAFSLSGSRDVSGLAAEVHATLATAGLTLDQFVAEFGANQFEISSPALGALEAADHAALAREAIRDAARARGAQASFAPKPRADAPGSGVHVHVSLIHDERGPVTARDDALTDVSGAFAAGVLEHIDAVLAFSTGSVNSFARLQPSSWVGAHGCFGTRNRETALRLVPRLRDERGGNPSASVEFRVADASASPYLTLAALIRAGLDGLDRSLSAPPDVQLDPATLDAEGRQALGISTLPEDLPTLLDRLETGGRARGWFGDVFETAFLSVRRNDLTDAQRLGQDYAEQFSRTV